MTQGKEHVPNEETKAIVSALSGFGITQEYIARYLDISEPTLRKHYRDDLDLGEVRANVKVARSLFNNATSGNVTAQIFWLKTRAGWKESVDLNLGNQGGKPFAVSGSIPPEVIARMSTEALRELQEALAASTEEQGE